MGKSSAAPGMNRGMGQGMGMGRPQMGGYGHMGRINGMRPPMGGMRPPMGGMGMGRPEGMPSQPGMASPAQPAPGGMSGGYDPQAMIGALRGMGQQLMGRQMGGMPQGVPPMPENGAAQVPTEGAPVPTQLPAEAPAALPTGQVPGAAPVPSQPMQRPLDRRQVLSQAGQIASGFRM